MEVLKEELRLAKERKAKRNVAKAKDENRFVDLVDIKGVEEIIQTTATAGASVHENIGETTVELLKCFPVMKGVQYTLVTREDGTQAIEFKTIPPT